MSRVLTLSVSMARIGAIVALFFVAACTKVERLAIPSAEAADNRWEIYDADSEIAVDHGAWDAFLEKYVSTDAAGVNRVAYGAVTDEDRAALMKYLEHLAGVHVTKLNRAEQLAFWINLYNAHTVALVIDNYPVDSIRDIGSGLLSTGPWKEEYILAYGEVLSLDDIEHGIVRPIFSEPRIHYALNCAAYSCPNLGTRAYRGGELDAQLDAAARAYVADPRGVQVDERGRLTVSKIYSWFREDFGKSQANVLAHIRQYASEELKAELADRRKINRYEYDWALNDAARAAN